MPDPNRSHAFTVVVVEQHNILYIILLFAEGIGGGCSRCGNSQTFIQNLNIVEVKHPPLNHGCWPTTTLNNNALAYVIFTFCFKMWISPQYSRGTKVSSHLPPAPPSPVDSYRLLVWEGPRSPTLYLISIISQFQG